MDVDKRKLYWPIEKLYPWNRNPKKVGDDDFERLKKQISELGEYKPLLITPQGEVIGGNSRLRAYREMGFSQCWVSVVEPKDEAQKIKYALSDNDNVGYYIEDQLADLVAEVESQINMADFSVDLSQEHTLLSELSDQIQINPQIVADDNFDLPSGDKAPFKELTFFLANDQVDLINSVLDMAKKTNDFSLSENKNINGNALAAICQYYYDHHDQG